MVDKFYIYLITNLLNGKVYVGKTNKPDIRWRNHKKFALGGKAKYPNDFFAVHAALVKYGINNFSFEIIDQFDSEEVAYLSETIIILLSCSNLNKYGYNCNLGGEGGIVPNEETRQKLIAAQNKPEMLKLHSDLMKKRHQDSPGFLSSVHKGNAYCKGMKHSEETKDKMSESHKNGSHRGEKIPQSKVNGNIVLEIREKYDSGNYTQNQLGMEYGLSQTSTGDIVRRVTWSHI